MHVCTYIHTYAYIPADAATLLCLRVTSTAHNQEFLSGSFACAHCNTDVQNTDTVVLLHVVMHAILMCKTVPIVHGHTSNLQF